MFIWLAGWPGDDKFSQNECCVFVIVVTSRWATFVLVVVVVVVVVINVAVIVAIDVVVSDADGRDAPIAII